MVNAQEYLNQNYPQEERKKITELAISNKNLEGELDLTDFASLKVLDCSLNKLTNIDLSNCKDLEKLSCYDNQLSSTDFLKRLPNPRKVIYLNLETPLTDQETISRVIGTEISWGFLKELNLLLKEEEMSHNAFLVVLKLIETELALVKEKETSQLPGMEYNILEVAEEKRI